MRPFLDKSITFKSLLLSIISIWLLNGCVASTRTVQEKSVETKKYSEIFFILPKNDPRQVAPRVVQEFRNMGLKVREIDGETDLSGGQGTGFLITGNGHILTCAHVVGDENQATVWISKARFEADVINRNKDLDLAILRLRNLPGHDAIPVGFRNKMSCRMGEEAYTIGFPLSRVLGDSARLSKGLVSTTAGLKDDPNQIQISAEVQPGSSGGPVFDSQGMVFGVVQKSLNPLKVLRQTGGALPQNVNFAVKSEIVIEYIRNADAGIYDALRMNDKSTIDKVADSVVKVRSGIISEESEKNPRLLVILSYRSIWDVWFRFAYFVLSFYDFDSQERLFVVGQGHDNPFSNEDSVIKDAFIKIRNMLKMN